MTVVGTARTKVGLKPLQSEVTPSTLLILTKASNVPLKYFGRLYLKVCVDHIILQFSKLSSYFHTLIITEENMKFDTYGLVESTFFKQ